MKSYLVDQCNDELEKLERASKLKFRTEYVNILYEIEFCAFIFRGKEQVQEVQSDVFAVNTELDYLCQLEKDVQQLESIADELGYKQ